MGYQEILGKIFVHTKMKQMSQTSFVLKFVTGKLLQEISFKAAYLCNQSMSN